MGSLLTPFFLIIMLALFGCLPLGAWVLYRLFQKRLFGPVFLGLLISWVGWAVTWLHVAWLWFIGEHIDKHTIGAKVLFMAFLWLFLSLGIIADLKVKKEDIGERGPS